MIYAVFALFTVVIACGIALYRIGKKAEKADILAEKADSTDEAARIRDKHDYDAEFRKRLSDRFSG